MKLKNITEQLNFTLFGDSAAEIFSLKYAHEADEKSLAVAYSDKDVIKTAATSVLTAPRVLPAGKNFLYCGFGEIGGAVVKVARLLI